MLRKAKERMDTLGAHFVFTGEVLGQRPMSQNKQSLNTVAKDSGYREYILRPLSAKLLPETKPEIEGKIDRERLLDICGRGRKTQLALAKHYGIKDYATPAGGCLLTDPPFSKRLKDLFDHQKDFKIKDVELLKLGRHFRTGESSKVIVGRNIFDNEAILRLSETEDIVINIANYPGPTTIIPSGCDDNTLHLAAAICALYSDAPKDIEVSACCRTKNVIRSVMVKAANRNDIKAFMI